MDTQSLVVGCAGGHYYKSLSMSAHLLSPTALSAAKRRQCDASRAKQLPVNVRVRYDCEFGLFQSCFLTHL
jgi:hypothetical protein